MSEPWHELRAQLIDLQTQLAFQEDALHTLDGVVAAQQKQLDKMAQANARLERQIAEIIDIAVVLQSLKIPLYIVYLIDNRARKVVIQRYLLQNIFSLEALAVSF